MVMGDSGGVERGERDDVLIVSYAGRCEWDVVDADSPPSCAESTRYKPALPCEGVSEHCEEQEVQGEDVLSYAAAQSECEDDPVDDPDEGIIIIIMAPCLFPEFSARDGLMADDPPFRTPWLRALPCFIGLSKNRGRPPPPPVLPAL